MRWTLALAVLAALHLAGAQNRPVARPAASQSPEAAPHPATAPGLASTSIERRLVEAALARTRHRVRYDARYRRIDYPGGDVPDDTGVCTDLVIRSYRALGLDLQEAVHEDMASGFASYPRLWGLDRPDPNIDHRRVPNLRVFFRRRGAALEVSRDPSRYQPGDLVTWVLRGNLPHIGIVTDRRSTDDRRPLIVHNIGAGPKLEDMLLRFPITGHYRYPVRHQPG